VTTLSALTYDGRSFVHTSPAVRVVFGAGALARVPDEVAALELYRVLVLSTANRQELADGVAAALGDRCAGVLPTARMHVPQHVAEQARAVARASAADGCVAVGGGSTVGLGKAVALEQDIPIVAVPTTYAGSEMTPVWGITAEGRKSTGRDPRVLPRAVVYDPELTLELPVDVSVTSGFNAVAHSVEALYAPDGSPVTSLIAAEGVRAVVAALPVIAERPADLAARTQALYGAWLSGMCLGSTTMALHHKVCHVLGGTFDLPHAPTHTVMLPYVLAFNAPAAPQAVDALRAVLDGDDPAPALQSLAGRLGAPRSLAELGLREEDIEPAAELVVAGPYANPRPVTGDDVLALLRAAYLGSPC
jgi:maleylacetate reductase